MANRIPKLTKRGVEALKANGADTVYWDGELTGFGVRVRKSGRIELRPADLLFGASIRRR